MQEVFIQLRQPHGLALIGLVGIPTLLLFRTFLDFHGCYVSLNSLQMSNEVSAK